MKNEGPLELSYVRDDVISKVLDELKVKNKDAYTNLLLGTCCVESDFGSLRRQHGIKNPFIGGYGIFQVEPGTYDWLVGDFLLKKPDIKRIVDGFFNKEWSKYENLKQNDLYQAAVSYLKYLSCEHKFSLPENPNDIGELARIWKKYYNTPLGKGKEEHFINKYEIYVTNRM